MAQRLFLNLFITSVISACTQSAICNAMGGNRSAEKSHLTTISSPTIFLSFSSAPCSSNELVVAAFPFSLK